MSSDQETDRAYSNKNHSSQSPHEAPQFQLKRDYEIKREGWNLSLLDRFIWLYYIPLQSCRTRDQGGFRKPQHASTYNSIHERSTN